MMNRREFTKMAGMGALAVGSFPAKASSMESPSAGGRSTAVPLGICNHALRSMRPNATQLIEFAIEHRLDCVQYNTLTVFESLEEAYLAKLKELAHTNDIRIYTGVGSICESSLSFSDRYGDADALLKKGIRVASALESPIVGVRIGNLEDRYTEGGIKPKMEEVIKRMKSLRGPVLDAGIKFAFENHAGDMRSEELLELIDEMGTDICGAFFDPGNAIYAMEDPNMAMEAVGKHILCAQARDVMIWATEDGAIFQWTAVGEGLTDFKRYTKFLSKNCPGVPIQIETISNSPRQVPYLKPEYWEGFPDLPASGIVDFLKLVRRGHPIDVAEAPAGTEKKSFDIENQKGEFLKSIKYLREECEAGLKS
jgi:sugar phosphate isomerase/epimerase